MELDRPFYASPNSKGVPHHERLPELEADPSSAVVASHDPAVMSMFEPITDECVDLSRAGPGLALRFARIADTHVGQQGDWTVPHAIDSQTRARASGVPN
jgi:hypothetical protein